MPDTPTPAANNPSPPQPQPLPPANPVTIDFAPLLAKLDDIKGLLNKQPNIVPGVEPIIPARAETIGDAYDKYSEMEAGTEKRRTFLVNGWAEINKAAKQPNRLPMNANTISATLTTAMLNDTVTTVIQARLAPIRAFALEVQNDPIKPLATVVLPKVTTAATVQTDPTNWESGDTVVGVTSITMHEYSQSFHVTSTELNSGTRMEWLTRINGAAIANKILDVCVTPVTVANFGAAVFVGAAATFAADDLPAIWAAAKDYTLRHLVIDGSYWARLIPTDTIGFPLAQGAAVYGFDGVWYNNRWTGAGTNVIGFVCDPQAILVATGLPLMPPGSTSEFQAIGSAIAGDTLIPIQTSTWFKAGTRVQWSAYDLMLGAAANDTTAGEVMTSA